MTDVRELDLDSIPDTRDLEPPTPEQLPRHVLANTFAIRSIRRDLRDAKRWFRAMVLAFVGGSVGIAGTVVGAAWSIAEQRGEERAVDAQQTEAIQENRERITHLERAGRRQEIER